MLNNISHLGNENQNHNEILAHTQTMALIKKTDNNNFWQGCGKSETPIHCCGDIKWCSCFGKQLGNFSKC